jgi:lipopolysaccharide O-acetyltransferase
MERAFMSNDYSYRSRIAIGLYKSLHGAAVWLILERYRQFRNRMRAKKFSVHKIDIGPSAMLKGVSAVQMGENFCAGPGLWLEAVQRYHGKVFNPRIVIGTNVSISAWGHITATHYVEIGDDVLIGSKVIITDHNHGQYSGPHSSPNIPPRLRPLDCDKEVVIGRNVWLGDGVVVTPGATIGEGAVIGANSVVIGTIQPFTLAAGIPAKQLKRYDFTVNEWVAVIADKA